MINRQRRGLCNSVVHTQQERHWITNWLLRERGCELHGEWREVDGSLFNCDRSRFRCAKVGFTLIRCCTREQLHQPLQCILCVLRLATL
jgi:hypothetical protein